MSGPRAYASGAIVPGDRSPNVEIERKFKIDSHQRAFVELIESLSPVGITQGYLSYDPVVRLRLHAGDPEAAAITVKGEGKLTRPEFNFAVGKWIGDEQVAEMIRDMCPTSTIFKYRYSYKAPDGKIWDIDEFIRPVNLIGLWIAEIELASEDEPFEKPSWLGEELTYKKGWSNAALVRYGLPDPVETDAYDEIFGRIRDLENLIKSLREKNAQKT